MKISRPLMSIVMTAVLLAVTATPSAADGLRRIAASQQVPVTAPTEVVKLVAPYPSANDEFGRSVATDGRTIVVGAPGIVDDHSRLTDGSAHVYVRKAWSWIHRQVLVSADDEDDESFGHTIVVGANGDDLGTDENAGSVHVFTHIEDDWIEAKELTSPTVRAWQNFGSSVAVWRNQIAVGAPGDAPLGLSGAGCGYEFKRVAGEWRFLDPIVSSDAAVRDHFGEVAVHGYVNVFGALHADLAGLENVGAAYVVLLP